MCVKESVKKYYERHTGILQNLCGWSGLNDTYILNLLCSVLKLALQRRARTEQKHETKVSRDKHKHMDTSDNPFKQIHTRAHTSMHTHTFTQARTHPSILWDLEPLQLQLQ